MSNFEKWSMYYSKGWATLEQIGKLVELSVLTPEEYQAITEEVYVA